MATSRMVIFICTVAREHGLINNTVCRQLLAVDRNRSSYLLRKLEKQGKLVSEGQGRWAQYRLREGMD